MFFDFYIGGFHGTSYNMQLKGNLLYVLEYIHHDLEAEPAILHIEDDPDCRLLITYLRGRKWKGRYYAEVCDGTQWTLEVHSDELNLQASGSNAYPRGFKRFLTLLNTLTAKVNVHVS